MARLSSRNYTDMLDLAVALLAAPEPASFWPLVAEQLQQALRGAICLFFDDFQYASGGRCLGGSVTSFAPSWLGQLPLNRIMQQLSSLHPVAQRYAGGNPEILAVSDVVDRRAWGRSEVCQQLREQFDSTWDIALPLHAPAGVVRAFVVGRPAPDFTERERAILQQLQPLLTSADAHLRQLDRWRRTAAEDLPSSTDVAVQLRITPRELVVLGALAEGLTVVAIAHRLSISPRTVIKHKENLYRKLGTNDRLTTVLRAQQIGLLTPLPVVRRNGGMMRADGDTVTR
jgi:DNA-binding CsgD family transcriptional regulator